MKKLILCAVIATSFVACNNEAKTDAPVKDTLTVVTPPVDVNVTPTNTDTMVVVPSDTTIKPGM